MSETLKQKKIDAARKLAEARYSFAQIAEKVGVDVRTLHQTSSPRWLKAFGRR